MKKLLSVLFFLSFSAFGADLALKLNCQTILRADGDVSVLSEKPLVLSTAGKNAHIFQTEVGSDQHNAVVVALQQVSKVCADNYCSETLGTVFNLILARVEDSTRNALQMAAPAKITGETSATAQITVSHSGTITSSFVRDGKIIMGAQGLPNELSFSYKVNRQKYGNQNIKVSCDVLPE